MAIVGHGTAAKATVISDNQIKADLKAAICEQDWQDAITFSSCLMASSTITPEHRQELVKWRYQFTQYAASGTVFSEIPNCGYNSSPDPKGESAFLPQSAPQSAPQSTPLSAHVSTPLSTPLNAPQSASLSAPLNAPQSIPLRASLNAPQNAPQNTPQSASLRAPLSTPVAPARVTAAPSAPRPTAALPDATCYITYSDGRTVNLESMCQ